MIQHSCTKPQFFVPTKVLLHFNDQKSALVSEHIRGQRIGAGFAGLVGVPAGTKRRTVYDARHRKHLPGVLVRGEGDRDSQDSAVNQAYDSAGYTYDFYAQILNRNSIDGKGMRLDSTVHFSRKFNNAFWNGTQMVYGDGDGELFTGFTGAVDVVAHELTHGVTQFTVPGGLDYEGQSGALNESISDVFGSVVKQWQLTQTVDQADWLIGAGIMKKGNALRSMESPGDTSKTWEGDDQPGDMDGFEENADVHTNSGIPNHAFYLAAMALGGNSWDKAAKIWYRALPLLTSTATFVEAAEATIHAVAVAGFGSDEAKAVTEAWKAVKVI